MTKNAFKAKALIAYYPRNETLIIRYNTSDIPETENICTEKVIKCRELAQCGKIKLRMHFMYNQQKIFVC